jgi:transcriptional regulator with XRE-family HTH domain
VADQERAQRIRDLRASRHWTQQRVVDELEKFVGKRLVTLRGYQDWERTGGIRWEKAQQLAGLYEVDPVWLYGEKEVPVGYDKAQLERLTGLLEGLHDRVDQLRQDLKLEPDQWHAAHEQLFQALDVALDNAERERQAGQQDGTAPGEARRRRAK